MNYSYCSTVTVKTCPVIKKIRNSSKIVFSFFLDPVRNTVAISQNRYSDASLLFSSLIWKCFNRSYTILTDKIIQSGFVFLFLFIFKNSPCFNELYLL